MWKSISILGLATCLNAFIARALVTFANTILVLAIDDEAASSVTLGLQGYGIPYETVIIPLSGVELPELISSDGTGKYGGIVFVRDAAYESATGYVKALTPKQYRSLYDYQIAFGVRMVRLDSSPDADSGTAMDPNSAGCCHAGEEQYIRITDTSAFPTANMKLNAAMSTKMLWHYPAVITNSSIATKIAEFDPSDPDLEPTVAAVIISIDGRQEMVWFIAWGTLWAPTSAYLQHAYIQWMTRGLFVGKRKLYFSTQVDDVHLSTMLQQPKGAIVRCTPDDLESHKSWQISLNKRLPPGSNYTIEMAHNGNGNIAHAVNTPGGKSYCSPDYAVQPVLDIDMETELEFQKPLGTGTSIWPPQVRTFTWSKVCLHHDDVALWFSDPSNRDVFAHISHTFTHMSMNKATYDDTHNEIMFNRVWLEITGISESENFSPMGLVPPAITGLRNGDAIKGWMENGVRYAIGSYGRDSLQNPKNIYWPRITDTDTHGYDGLVIVPRFASAIPFDCDTVDCTVQEPSNQRFDDGVPNFDGILKGIRAEHSRNLLALRHDPFMFHQANMRLNAAGGNPATQGFSVENPSLLQIWAETVLDELTRLVDWPIITLKLDDLGKAFLDRMTLDECAPNLLYTLSHDKSSITQVTVTASTDRCAVPVPVTFPGFASTDSAAISHDRVGSEPLIIWTELSGSPVVFTLEPHVPMLSYQMGPAIQNAETLDEDPKTPGPGEKDEL